jgi:hypothetical protein
MENLNNMFNDISTTSKKARVSFLNKVDLNNLNNVDKTLNDYVNTSDNIGTQYNRIKHIFKYLEESKSSNELYNKYKKIGDDLSNQIHIKRDSNNLENDKKSERYIELSDLKIKLLSHYPTVSLKELKKNNRVNEFITSINKLQDFLLISLYVNNAPLRNDYADINIVSSKKVTTDTKKNYMVLNNKSVYIILNVYKNSERINNQYKIEISKYNIKLIRLLKSLYKIIDYPFQFLFNHISRNKIEKSTDTSLVKRIPILSTRYFGKPLSINDYRHIYEMELQHSERYKNMNIIEREHEHQLLLHSTSEAMRYNRV